MRANSTNKTITSKVFLSAFQLSKKKSLKCLVSSEDGLPQKVEPDHLKLDHPAFVADVA